MIELINKEMRLLVSPEVGGALAGLQYSGENILRSSEHLEDVRNSASYPLVPYSNRIANGSFSWQGKTHQLALNFGAHPHSIHGLGWQRSWDIVALTREQITLKLSHQPDDDWPFAFLAKQVIQLQAQSLTMQLRVQNIDAQTQPLGLGWHPYFFRRAHSHIATRMKSQWLADATQLPVDEVPCLAVDSAVSELAFDNCFSGWSRSALIEDEKFRLTLSADCDHLVIYTPPGKDFFCLEPVSHVNNAIHAPNPTQRGLVAAQPGQAMERSLQLRVSAKRQGQWGRR